MVDAEEARRDLQAERVRVLEQALLTERGRQSSPRRSSTEDNAYTPETVIQTVARIRKTAKAKKKTPANLSGFGQFVRKIETQKEAA